MVSREEFMSTTQAKSNQINADDLLGGPLVCQITEIEMTGSSDQPVAIYVDAHPQPWKPSKTSRRVLMACWSDVEPSQWVGRWMVLYNEKSVSWGGESVGGIRTSHLSHITERKSIAVNLKKGKKGAQVVEPYYPTTEAPAPKEPVFWPDDAFEKQINRATDAILAGEKTADAIISALESKAPLTVGQKARIQAIKAPEPEAEPEPTLEENPDPFAED